MNRAERRAARKAHRAHRHPVDSVDWLASVLADPRTDTELAHVAVHLAAAADGDGNVVVLDDGQILAPSKWDGRGGRIHHLCEVAA